MNEPVLNKDTRDQLNILLQMRGDLKYVSCILSTITYAVSIATVINIIFFIIGINWISTSVSLIIGGIFTYRFYLSLYSMLGRSKNPSKPSESDRESKPSTTTRRIRVPFRVSEEDRIIVNHLFDRHKNILSYADALDAKIAQIIALNGLILSFVFFRAGEAISKNVYIYGLILILISIVLGILGYAPKNFYAGASPKFFEDCDTFKEGEAVKKLKKQLTMDVKRNEKTQNFKANILSHMLVFLIVGLITLVVGYYA